MLKSAVTADTTLPAGALRDAVVAAVQPIAPDALVTVMATEDAGTRRRLETGRRLQACSTEPLTLIPYQITIDAAGFTASQLAQVETALASSTAQYAAAVGGAGGSGGGGE